MTTANTVEAQGSEYGGSIELHVDSGSSHHILRDERFFVELKPASDTREVRLGNSSTLKVEGSGVALLAVQQGNKVMFMELREALLVPTMNANLISLGQLTKDGYKVDVEKDRIAMSSGRSRVVAQRRHGLYTLRADHVDEPKALQASCETKVSLREVHQVLAHVGKNKVVQLLNRYRIPYQDDLDNCMACDQGKQHKQPSRTRPDNVRATEPGVIHGDTCSATEPSMGGHKHFLCLTDEFSKYRRVYFIKAKDEVPECI